MTKTTAQTFYFSISQYKSDFLLKFIIFNLLDICSASLISSKLNITATAYCNAVVIAKTQKKCQIRRQCEKVLEKKVFKYPLKHPSPRHLSQFLATPLIHSCTNYSFEIHFVLFPAFLPSFLALLCCTNSKI